MKHIRWYVPMLLSFSICLPAIYALGRTQSLKGTLVAYDPLYHGLKQASFVKNLEVTVADVGSTGKERFVKVVFEGFGDRQLSDDVLNGEKPFAVRGVRDKTCDEAHPRVLREADWEADSTTLQGSGTFLLNKTHRTKSLGPMENLECYRVEVPSVRH